MARLALVVFLLLSASLSGCGFFSSTSTKYILYTVAPGDSLSSIGARFNSNTEILVDLNRISDPDQLMIGALVKIPYSAIALNGSSSGRGTGYGGTSRKPSGSRDKSFPNGGEFVGQLRWPLARGTGRLSSKFGKRWRSFHEGIDLAARSGSSIYAVQDGKVVYSGRGLRGYGNLVVVKHKEELLTVYAHNSKNLVRKGAIVRKGDKIALVGATGKANGPHLHFETRVKDRREGYIAVDPMTFY